jgi:hypothetical protein
LLTIPGIGRHLRDEKSIKIEKMNFQRQVDKYEIEHLRSENADLLDKIQKMQDSFGE